MQLEQTLTAQKLGCDVLEPTAPGTQIPPIFEHSPFLWLTVQERPEY